MLSVGIQAYKPGASPAGSTMKWIITVSVLAIVGVILYIERWNIEQWAESFTADRIESSLHDKSDSGPGSSSPSVVRTFAKGVGKRVLNAEIGRI